MGCRSKGIKGSSALYKNGVTPGCHGNIPPLLRPIRLLLCSVYMYTLFSLSAVIDLREKKEKKKNGSWKTPLPSFYCLLPSITYIHCDVLVRAEMA